jgi:Zn-dependent alcohol dehydrogenase
VGVALRVCGVCLTGLACRDGGITDEYAVLFGHEAAGLIKSTGSDATRIAVGDSVVRKLACGIRTALSV